MPLTVCVAYNHSKAVVFSRTQNHGSCYCSSKAISLQLSVGLQAQCGLQSLKAEPPSSLSVLGITALASGSSAGLVSVLRGGWGRSPIAILQCCSPLVLSPTLSCTELFLSLLSSLTCLELITQNNLVWNSHRSAYIISWALQPGSRALHWKWTV